MISRGAPQNVTRRKTSLSPSGSSSVALASGQPTGGHRVSADRSRQSPGAKRDGHDVLACASVALKIEADSIDIFDREPAQTPRLLLDRLDDSCAHERSSSYVA